MKFQLAATVTGLSACVWIAAAAPDQSAAKPGSKAPAKSLELLIEELSDDKYKTREEASRQIWALGESALSALQGIAAGDDPERAYRARELIWKIQMEITPDTDPAIASLVERYAKAPPNEKLGLFQQLRKKRAWRQMLKLYAAETNPEFQAKLQQGPLAGVAIVAARESLANDDPTAAREFLEMAPADAAGLLALADFHRSQGTLDAELKRAKSLKGAEGEAWQLALYRASGDLAAARDAATAAGETLVSATMSALLGDPLPWLRNNEVATDGGMVHKYYSDLAIRRWQGDGLRPADLEPLERGINSKNQMEQRNAVSTLFLLGETTLGEKGYLKRSPAMAFSFFESLERIPDALKALELDPDQPDYAGWVEKRIHNLALDDEEEEHGGGMDVPELVLLANFLGQRGLRKECDEAFLTPLAALAEKDAKVFTDFLSTLFGGSTSMGGEADSAPLIARQAAVAWAGDNPERWDEIVEAAFGEQEEMAALWTWLGELDPNAGKVERFDGMLALFGMGRDPERLREKWLDLAWDAVRKTPADKRLPLLQSIGFVTNQFPDVATSLKVWDMLPEEVRSKEREQMITRAIFDYRSPEGSHADHLTAAGRWDDAAKFYLDVIARLAKMKGAPQPAFHAAAGACLRKAGRAAEAAAQEALVEKLALGNNALEIATAYASCDDQQHAVEWWARAARQSEPGTRYFSESLREHAQAMLDRGNWKEAAAICEVRAQFDSSVESPGSTPLFQLRTRLQADLAHALDLLKSDRERALAILANCHRMFPSDGSLADDFFPALRKMGLIEEHDEWFQISWERMIAVLERYPGSHNTCNTTAWLASRAQRNLDEAEKLELRALASLPNQSAYLDTMAELQFAKGKREKALEWSRKAVNFMPNDPILRRQQERFRTGPLPR